MAPRWKYRRWWIWLLLFCIAIALAYAFAVGTTTESGLRSAKTGVVLDADTGQPLAGVYVVVRWQETITNPFLIGHGNWAAGGCVYRDIVRTDSQGRYTIPATYGNFNIEGNLRLDRSKEYTWDLYTYSPGYGITERKIASEIGPLYAGHPEVASRGLLTGTQTLEPVLLAKDNNTSPGQRVEALASISWRFACKASVEPPAAVFDLFYAEVYSTACTPTPNNAALQLDQFRRSATPPMPPTSYRVDAQVEEITKRYPRSYPYMAQVAVATQDAQQLCTLLGPANKEQP